VRHGWARSWFLPALLGLFVAVLGTGGAIALSDDGTEPSAFSTATGGSLTVRNTGSTLTAPEPTGTTTAETPPAATTPPATTAPARPRTPAAVTWPRDRRGWTIVLLSLPQANGRDAAVEKAAEARNGGLRRVGVLDSSNYASLHPGYYVVFMGIFDTEAEAASALQRARAVFSGAYQREIVP
jgi:hypothetical protein